jgi:crossover junction endodeoxyribonuclease RusA
VKLTEEQYQAILRRHTNPGSAPQASAAKVPLLQSVYVSLDWPPTGNHCYTVARGRKILANKGRNYRHSAVARIREQANGKSVQGRLRVRILASPPDRRARDLDNLIKLPLDCLQKAGVIENDAKIDELTVQRLHPCLDGLLQIYVSQIL